MCELESFDNGADGRGFERAKAPVLQIEVMNNPGQSRNSGLVDAEHGAERLERATFVLMTELDAKHVERNPVRWNRVAIRGEGKPCFAIDEAPDQPGRRHAIDAWAWTSDPELTTVRALRVSHLRRRTSVRRRACTVFDLFNEGDDAVAAGAAEEVDVFDRGEPLTQLLHRPPRRHALRSARAGAGPPQHFFGLTCEFGVGILARAAELFYQRIVCPGINGVGDKNARLPTRTLDVRLQPLEVLASIRRIWQHVHGLLDGKRTDLLQASPRPDTEIRGMRRKLMHQHEPPVG
jgi:hypothetical protein